MRGPVIGFLCVILLDVVFAMSVDVANSESVFALDEKNGYGDFRGKTIAPFDPSKPDAECRGRGESGRMSRKRNRARTTTSDPESDTDVGDAEDIAA